MFLKPQILNSLMKKAYKARLTVGQTEDGWIYLAGMTWEAGIRKEFIPKRTMGDIVALAGKIPDPGERLAITKEGNTPEEGKTRVYEEMFDKDTLTVTDLLLVGTTGTIQRILQDENTGEIYIVNNVFVNIVDNGLIDEERGEYAAGDPFYSVSGILWKNNVCKLRAGFRMDSKNDKILRELQGADITPEIPG
jgi:hypothetical protein